MIVTWLSGYIRLKIKAAHAQRFLNICNGRGIIVREVSVDKDYCHFTVSLKDYYELKGVARKTKPGLRITEKHGFPFFISYLSGRRAFLAGILAFLVIIAVLGLFVWNIRIGGNSYYTDSYIYRYLEDKGVKYGAFKGRIDCEQLEKEIRQDFENIIWVSVALRGTGITIDIREKEKDVDTDIEHAPSRMIADRDGVIYSIVTRQGTPLVKKGDIVKKGDVLIDSEVLTYDEGGNKIMSKQVYADGEVYIYSQYPYSNVIKREHEEMTYTGRGYKTVSISLLGKNINLSPYKERYKNEDITGFRHDIRLYESFYLPLSFTEYRHREYEIVPKIYGDDELKDKLDKEFSIFLENLTKKGIQIMEKNVTMNLYDDEGQMYGFVYAVTESISREETVYEYN